MVWKTINLRTDGFPGRRRGTSIGVVCRPVRRRRQQSTPECPSLCGGSFWGGAGAMGTPVSTTTRAAIERERSLRPSDGQTHLRLRDVAAICEVCSGGRRAALFCLLSECGERTGSDIETRMRAPVTSRLSARLVRDKTSLMPALFYFSPMRQFRLEQLFTTCVTRVLFSVNCLVE